MRMLIKTCLAVVTLSLFSIFPVHAAETYKLEPAHTYVVWHVNHFGFSDVQGRLPAEGTLILDEANPQNSQVSVIINTAKLSTGVEKFDDMLKGGGFFAVSRYPTATFVSNKVEVSGKSAKVYGTLTMRGTSRPIVLNMKLNKIGRHPYYLKKGAGFSGTASLQRSAFGMGAFAPGVSDTVRLDIQSEALVP